MLAVVMCLVWSSEVEIMFCRLRSSLWLQFKPHHIAAGAAYLAAKFLNMDLAGYQNIWQEFQTSPSILQGTLHPLHLFQYHVTLSILFCFEMVGSFVIDIGEFQSSKIYKYVFN